LFSGFCRLSFDSGVMLLALVECRRNVAAALAALIADRRDPSHIRHTVADVPRARMLAIDCGYPDGNDFDWLRRVGVQAFGKNNSFSVSGAQGRN
jgi:Transposase DDE domain group 1